jgi:XTP/dITP diphosphohydrolase
MKKIIFATNNQHKLTEIQHIIGDRFQISGLDEIGFKGDIIEYGKTLKENASIKSRHIFDLYKLDCFADDTGLEIDALEGRPGVFSARYAGEEGNAENNIKKVLEEMQDIQNRKARFLTVISLILDGEEYFFEGKIEGTIIKSKQGSHGFGYDPIFIPNGYKNTFAEMPAELKNRISHRANAMAKLTEFLMQKV